MNYIVKNEYLTAKQTKKICAKEAKVELKFSLKSLRILFLSKDKNGTKIKNFVYFWLWNFKKNFVYFAKKLLRALRLKHPNFRNYSFLFFLKSQMPTPSILAHLQHLQPFFYCF